MKKRLFAWVTASVLLLSSMSGMIFSASAVETTLRPLVEEYGRYDFALFTEGEKMASVYERAQLPDADADSLLAEAARIEKKLKNVYPFFVPYAQKENYAALTEGVKDWAITCSADWRAAVASRSGFEGQTLHLTNDIDMEGIAVDPMCTSGLKFKGTLNGHGFVFKNLLIDWDLANGNYVGLIGYSERGRILELGLESGLVRAYGKQTTEAKVGGLLGEGDHVTLRHCSSAVTVDSSSADGNGGQTVSGLARTRGNSVIDGCFSVGIVKGTSGSYAGTLCGYNQQAAVIYNSFGYGTALGGTTSFVRYGKDGCVSQMHNCYDAGNSGSYCPKNVSIDVTSFRLSADAYRNGELAWKLNSGMAGNTETYYTLKNQKTVFGTAENQTHRITLQGEGLEPKYMYASAGEQVKLFYTIGATYSGAEDLVGNLLTMPAEDITIEVTLGNLDYSALEDAVSRFDAANLQYIENEEAVKQLLEAVKNRCEIGYPDQESIDADVRALQAAFVWVAPEEFPSVTEIENEKNVPGYTVKSLSELEFVTENVELFGIQDTIYFAEDITVTEGSSAHSMKGLSASLNGLGHTLRGIRCSGDAWLGDYRGKSVRQLNFEDCHAAEQPWQGALLIKKVLGDKLVLEDLSFRNCSVSNGSGNGLAIVVGLQQNFGVTEMRRITVEHCTMDRGTSAGNSGFLMGREQNGTLIAEDCYLNKNTVLGVFGGAGKGIAFGEVTGTASMKNIGIFNTVVEGNSADAVLIGTFKNCDSGESPGILEVENVYSGNNRLPGLIRRGNTTGVILLGNAYTDGNSLIYYQNGLGEPVGDGANSAESLCGGAYALNKAGVEKKWEFPAGGNAPVWDIDGQGLPVKVTFLAGASEINYYTDTQGKLVNADESIFKYAQWEGISDLAALQSKVFTEDRVYEGNLGEVYKVMSQNLCVWGGADKKPYMVQLVNKFEPDIILMQEGKIDWVEYLEQNLKGYSMYYKYRSSDNESCPVAWKTDKFDVVEKGHFWISDTPDVMSKGWDGGCYRIVTWVVLKSKVTGEQMVVSSFHLDHQGKIARDKGGPLVYDRLLEIRERYPGSMFFTAADFNCGEGSVAYNALIQGSLEDVRYAAEETTTRPTYGNGLSPDWSSAKDSNRIDFMMTDTTTAKVMKFQVLEEIYGKTETSEGTRISDHNGLMATVVSMATKRAECAHKWTVTDNKDGTHKRTCTAGCGYSEDVAHSARFTMKDGATHGVSCVYCTMTATENCVMEESVVAPTCTAAGSVTRFCDSCKYSVKTAGEPAKGHHYEWKASKLDYLCSCGAAYAVQDANGDKAVDTADAVAILQYLTGNSVELDVMAADYKRDHQITVADAVALLRLISQ